jgi:allophanate hydrolase
MKISENVAALYDRLESAALNPVWISLVPRESAVARARNLENRPGLPLAGMTFAVKDNIDVAGLPTTAGCPAYAYTPALSATVVRRLEDAGAILVGKTNMDQFATGLVGSDRHLAPAPACSMSGTFRAARVRVQQ